MPISSINSEPIVVGIDGIGSDLAADVHNLLGEYVDDGLTSLPASDWTNGGIQTSSSSPEYGHVVYATHTVCLRDKRYASEPVQVFCDAGWLTCFIPYSGEADSSCIYNSAGYTYNELMWKRVQYIPEGIYYRVSMRKDPHSSSNVLDPAESHLHIHFVTSGSISFRRSKTDPDDITPTMLWKLGEMSNGVPNWTKHTHLLSPEIMHADKPIKVVADDSVVRPYVYYYDDEGTSLKYVRGASIPQGANYRLDLNVRDGSAQGHYDMTYGLSLIEMDGNFFWYGTSSTTAIAYTDTRIIQCMPVRYEHPVVISLADYTTYRVGTYLRTDDKVVSTHDYEALRSGPIGVPAGQWFHIYMGKVGDAAFTVADIEEAVSLLRVEPIHGVGSAIDGVRNELSVLKKRVTELEGEVIPDYYEGQSYSLAGKIADILDENSQPKESVVQFAFVTDFHANAYAQSFKTRALLNKIFSETHCSMFVNGGDTMNGKLTSDNTQVSPIDFAKGMQEWSQWLVPDTAALSLMVVGNHDGGVDYNPSTPARIDEHTLYEVSALGLTAGNVVLDANSKCSYYVDDEYHRIRWLVCNVGNTSNVGKWSTAGSGVTGESLSDAISFAGQALGSMRDGWTAVVFNHILINTWTSGPSKGAKDLEDLCDLFKSRGSASIQSRLFNFADAEGEIACIIGGHLHIDYDYTTDGGISCIITTTDNRGGQCRLNEQTNKLVIDATIRPNGTADEQAFDVFTIDTVNKTISTVRIGFGVDRSWSY